MAPRKVHLAAGIIIWVAFSIIFYYWFLGTPNYLPAKLLGLTSIPYWFPIRVGRSITSGDIMYVAVSLILVLTGAEMADYDKMITRLEHRDWLTHSVIIPGILSAIVLIFNVVPIGATIGSYIQSIIFGPQVDTTLVLAMSVFALGAASHLLLDYFPPIKPEELHSKKGSIEAGNEGADYFISGMTARELFRRLEGTALVHFWWNIRVKREDTSKPKGAKVRRESNAKDEYVVRRTLQPRQSQTYYVINGAALVVIGLLLIWQFLIAEASTTMVQFIITLLL
jgi:hypothetical protein